MCENPGKRHEIPDDRIFHQGYNAGYETGLRDGMDLGAALIAMFEVIRQRERCKGYP